MEEHTFESLKTARRITWAFFMFGAAATIGVNLAYAQNAWGPKMVSIIAPLSVLGVVEILGRVPFKKNLFWTINKYVITGMVGGAALFVSYYHIAHLALSYGFDPMVAWAQPIVTDGMMIISAMALISIKNHTDELIQKQRDEKEAAERKAEADAEEQVELGEAKEQITSLTSEKEELERQLELTKTNLGTYHSAEEEEKQMIESMNHLQKEAWRRQEARHLYMNYLVKSGLIESSEEVDSEEELSKLEVIDAAHLSEKFSMSMEWAKLRISEVDHDMRPIPLKVAGM